MSKFLNRIFEIIEVGKHDDKLSKFYDSFLLVIIILSILPLLTKDSYTLLNVLEYFCLCIFIIDYLLRLITANIRFKQGFKSFLIQPFTPFAIIDIISILPFFRILASSFKLLKTFRLFRCLRIFKVFRCSKSITILCNVINNQKESLISIFSMALMYIFLTALLMFNVEPDSFENFFDAVYWAVTALTTVGYGDIYPVTSSGKIVSMISSLFGVAMVALPAGVITAGFMDELNKNK